MMSREEYASYVNDAIIKRLIFASVFLMLIAINTQWQSSILGFFLGLIQTILTTMICIVIPIAFNATKKAFESDDLEKLNKTAAAFDKNPPMPEWWMYVNFTLDLAVTVAFFKAASPILAIMALANGVSSSIYGIKLRKLLAKHM